MTKIKPHHIALLSLLFLAGCRSAPRTVSLPEETVQTESTPSLPGKLPLSGPKSRKIETH